MIYEIEKYVPIESLTDLKQTNYKEYRVEQALMQELLSDLNLKKGYDIDISSIKFKIPFDLYLYVEFDLGIVSSVEGFLIRNINLKIDEEETVKCLELLFLQEGKVIRDYRIPLENGNTLKDIICSNKFISKIKTYYGDIEDAIKQEKSNILMAFLIVQSIVSENN